MCRLVRHLVLLASRRLLRPSVSTISALDADQTELSSSNRWLSASIPVGPPSLPGIALRAGRRPQAEPSTSPVKDIEPPRLEHRLKLSVRRGRSRLNISWARFGAVEQLIGFI
jgi:hypothetical protein